jgi:hypothetical protein
MTDRGNSILIYGRSKLGKTVDTAYAFQRAFWILTEPGALVSVPACLGYMPKHKIEILDISSPYMEAKGAIEKHVLPGIKSGAISSVVIDTASELTDRMLGAELERVKDPRQAYQSVTNNFKRLIRMILKEKAWVIAICHESAPSTDDSGAFHPGGPLFPGKGLIQSVPSLFDTILRADVEMGRRVYRCDPLSPLWRMGDRSNVTTSVQPMELAVLVFKMLHPGQVPPPGTVKQIIGGETAPMVGAATAPVAGAATAPVVGAKG